MKKHLLYLLCPLFIAAANAQESADTQALRDYAEKCGKKIGVAVPVWRIDVTNDGLPETQAVYNNFNILVAENEMKIDALQPNRGQFEFYHGDNLVNFAERHGMTVRGHTLCWYKQVSGWISSDGGQKNDHNYSREELLEILKDHITTVVTHYKGRVHEWDVVNECLADDQSIVRTNPTAYALRPSVWYTGIGEDFIDSAFVYAHRADPDAKLYLNDYGVEMQGSAKTQAYYNLARRLQKSGIPIDGVGFQFHFTVGEVDSAKFDNNVKRYASLGLNCIVTELDMSIPDLGADDAYEKQAADYRTIAEVMIKYDHCPNVVIWGVKDDQSWREGEPLLFNAQMQAKPAFYALYDLYKEYAENLPAGIESTAADAVGELPPFVDVYDLMGRSVAKQMPRERIYDLPAGLYIIDQKKMAITH